ncbi:hypothetical protein M404DRAFT_432032 [Pisolithus tinctorius Marx 270]|uniref:Uncharacterized protein n=1 Tax=Pisolithus tinctorius Marx 270 TaxID=870435 RepID=A0A0C3KC67_PISTI|nr:hypothetical protein M404DRAFT_432032 [Pisolithus tinctorius Marx 270]
MHSRSTSSVISQKSSRSTLGVAYWTIWTISFVHHTPVLPPLSKEPLVLYQPYATLTSLWQLRHSLILWNP